MATEQFPVGSDVTSGEMAAEQSKPSFVDKVKTKARKLKSKMKHHGSTDGPHDPAASPEAPSPGGRQGRAYTPRAVGQDNNESDSSESDDDEGNEFEIPYTPLSNSVQPSSQSLASATATKPEGTPFGALTSGQNAYGSHSTGTRDSFPADPAVMKSAGPPGIQQAVPTNYNYYNSDPSEATLPSGHDDTSQRQRDVPSSVVGESAGLTSVMDKLSNAIEHCSSSKDGSLSRSGHRASELPQSFMACQDSEEKSDSGLVQPSLSSLVSKPLEQDSGVGFPEPSSMGALTPHNFVTDFSEFAGSNAPFPEKVSDTTGGLVGLAPTSDAVGVPAGVSHSRDHAPFKDAENSSKSFAAKYPYEIDSDRSPTPESVNGGSNNDISSERQAVGRPTSASAEGAEEVMDTNGNRPSSAEESSPWTQKAYELKNSLAGTFGYAGSSASQAENSTAAKISPNDAEQKPLMSRVAETAYGLKDTVASKLGYDEQTMSTTNSTPVSQKLAASAVQGKDYAVQTFQSADHDSSPDEKPLSEKGSEAAGKARESALQKTTPDHHDKALADSISDSITGLPGILTSKLGLGGDSPAASPSPSNTDTELGSALKDGAATSNTPMSAASSCDSSTRKDTPYPDHASTTTTAGLFNRVSGIASSLFGGGAKNPATEKKLSSESKSF